MARRTRQSQSTDLTTGSADKGDTPLENTTDTNVTLQCAVDGRRVNPRRTKRDLGKGRTSSTPDATAPPNLVASTTNIPPPTKRTRKSGRNVGRQEASDVAAPATESAPPAKKARKDGNHVGRQEGLKNGPSDLAAPAIDSPPATQTRKIGPGFSHRQEDSELEVGETTEEDREQEDKDAPSIGATQGQRPPLQRSYAFYDERSSDSMQNDQPRANITDGSSDIEDEADWHDEVNVEELAPRHRSAKDVEMPIWRAPATSPELSTSDGAHLSQTGVVTSATLSASGNNIPSQQGGANGALLQRDGANGAPLQRGGANGAPSQQGGGNAALLQQVGRIGAALPRRGKRGVAAALHQCGGDATIGTPAPDMPLWPADTNLIFQEGTTKILLMGQPSLLRVVIQDAMDNFHADLLSTHAFPDLTTTLTVIRASLLSSSKAHFPSALNIHTRLQSDNNYVATISRLVRARIPHYRGTVKEECSYIVIAELLLLDSPDQVSRVVESQISSYNYTFPMAPNSMRPSTRTKPYRNHRIITAIQNLYFKGGAESFASKHNHFFPSYTRPDGVTVHEVPIPMVALVATALYAALREWRTGVQQAAKFSANAYLDMYQGHVNTFNQIRARRNSAFHLMMADLYTQASLITEETTVPMAQLDWDELDG